MQINSGLERLLMIKLGRQQSSNDASFSAFECRYFFFGDTESGIAVAGVNVGAAFSLGPALHFRGGRKGKCGGTANLSADGGANSMFSGFSGVDGERAGAGILAAAGSFAGFHGAIILEGEIAAASTNLASCDGPDVKIPGS